MEKAKKANILIYLSTLVIMILSTISHFLYEWSNYNYLVAYIAPTNESIFQHIKMFSYAIIVYYFVTFLIFAKRYKLRPQKWIMFPLITIVITSMFVVSFYYVFKYAFSYSSMGLDLLAFILGLFISSLICKRFYKYEKFKALPTLLSLTFTFVLIISLVYFDANPAKVDLFYDNINKTYEKVIK